MTKQKVLVFDDNATHRQIAQWQLGSICELTIVSTYDEAQKELVPKRLDRNTQDKLREQYMADAGLPENLDPRSDTASDEQIKLYHLTIENASQDANVYPMYDVVLTDLLMKPSKQSCSRNPLCEQEMPVGSIIALLAIAAGVKKVGVVTDMGHHDHPASAALDCFSEFKAKTDLICTQSHNTLFDTKTGEEVTCQYVESIEGKAKYPPILGADWGNWHGITWGKNWLSILNRLNNNTEPDWTKILKDYRFRPDFSKM